MKLIKSIITGYTPPNQIKKATLQVRIRLHRDPTDERRAAHGVRMAASLTLEAAFVLPLFLFAMAALVLPLRMMDTSRKMQSVAEAVCRDAAALAYTADRAAKGQETKETAATEAGGLPQEIGSLLKGNALGLYTAELAKRKAADANIRNLLAIRSNCMGDGETITITLDYEYALPFPVLGLPPLMQSVTASRRAWIGSAPEEDKSASGEEKEDEDVTVYVGKSSTRYHLDRTCHYLFNDLQAVPFALVSSERNADGGRYHACPRCASGVKGGTVYIMPSGTAWHASPDCSAISAYVKAVPKSSVEYLGACHYCGGE